MESSRHYYWAIAHSFLRVKIVEEEKRDKRAYVWDAFTSMIEYDEALIKIQSYGGYMILSSYKHPAIARWSSFGIPIMDHRACNGLDEMRNLIDEIGAERMPIAW